MAPERLPSHPLALEALVERRTFLARTILAATAVAGTGGLAALLDGCSSSATDTARGPSTSVATPTGTAPVGTIPVEAFDPDRPYWMQGNFGPVAVETTAIDLPIEGSIPSELAGLFVRNGSNPATGDSPHWFLGDGMVHGVRLNRGKAEWYRNRYVQTSLYKSGKGGLSAPPGGASNQSNVSAFVHAGKLLTSGEVGFPYELSPTDLSTVGAYDYGGQLHTAMTAHPKIDPATGKLHFFGYGFVPPYLTYHVAGADGRLEYSEAVTVSGPTMIHDFAITESDVVFWELPVVFSLEDAVRAINGGLGGGQFPFKWDPSYGARIGVMPLGGPTSAIRWVEIDPCYVFHGTNAHRDGDHVVLDVCRMPSMFGPDGDQGKNSLRRWTVDTSAPALTFSEQTLNDVQMDLPGIDRRYVGRAYRHGWYPTIDDSGAFPFEFAGLNHVDHVTLAQDRWEPGPSYRAGEVVFVAASPKANEGEGWLLTYAYDKTTGRSDLIVLDAQKVAAGPVAKVHLPVRVPYGFHGWWLPDQPSGVPA